MGETRSCTRCGAVVAPEADWCGQCFAPLPRRDQEASLQTRLRPHAPPVREPMPAPIYSRWRASDTSFGALGRGLLTMALAIGLLVGEPLARGLVLATVGFDVPGRGFVLLYATFAVPTGVYLIARIWKRARIS